MSASLAHTRNQRQHPQPAPSEWSHRTPDENQSNTSESGQTDLPDDWNLVDTGVAIPGPPNYGTSQIFHHKWNEQVDSMPETLAAIFCNTPHWQVVEGPVAIQPPQVPVYSSWSEYFQQHREEQARWASAPRSSSRTRPLQVRPRPRPFTPHPDYATANEGTSSGEADSEEMEHQHARDILPNTPEHPTTPLERMDKDDLWRLHPALPSNTKLEAAGNTGLQLTQEQHRIFTFIEEGNTLLYSSDRRTRHSEVKGDQWIPNFVSAEQKAITDAQDTPHMGIITEGSSAPGQPNIEDLVTPEDLLILRAFAQELQNWPEIDQFLNEAFGDNR